ncbi:Transmembrane protein 131 [Nymphon striatum]|nr:Transmembrane protein 131 [Nymphon striatum]
MVESALFVNVTLQLDTEDVQGFLLQSRAYLKWPRLSSKKKLKFSLTQIGNISVKEFVLENPASHPVLAQVVMLSSYPNQQMALDLLNHFAVDLLSDVIETENPDLFILKDLEKYEKKKDNPIPGYRSAVEGYFGVQAHKDSIVVLMNPGAKVKLRIGFVPLDERLRSSLILIRNNLTVLDTVVIEGQGGHGEIKFGNKRPSLDSSLLLEMTEKHLTDCGRAHDKAKIFPSRFTVKRSFTARNTGELPVYISNFYISGSPCQGYGFRILNCNGFLLKPNASFVVDIACGCSCDGLDIVTKLSRICGGKQPTASRNPRATKFTTHPEEKAEEEEEAEDLADFCFEPPPEIQVPERQLRARQIVSILCSIVLPSDPEGLQTAIVHELVNGQSNEKKAVDVLVKMQEALPLVSRQRQAILAALSELLTYSQMKHAIEGIGTKSMRTAKRNYRMIMSGIEIPMPVRSIAGNCKEKVRTAVEFILSPDRIKTLSWGTKSFSIDGIETNLFTPDFTLTRIEQILSIETSLSNEGKYLNYSLVATVPANMLKICAESLPPNPWDQILYYSLVCVMIIFLFIVFVVAYFESERIFGYKSIPVPLFGPMNNDSEMKNTPVFDLKNISSTLTHRKTSVKKASSASSSVKRKNEKMYAIPVVNYFLKNRSKSPNKSNSFSNTLENVSMNGSIDNQDICEQLLTSSKVENCEVNSHVNCSTNYKKKSRKDEICSSDTANKKDYIEKSSNFKTSWSNIFKGSNNKNISNEQKLNNKDLQACKSVKNNSEDNKELYSPDQLIEIMDKDMCTKNWSTKLKNKKRNFKNISNHETDLIKTLVKKSQNNEEETSSTTTETSNPDSDNSTEKDMKPVVNVKLKHKSSNKNNSIINKYENKTVSVKGTDDDGDNNGDFELSTKSKAHKKIKIDPSKVYGGDILKPSTLELPYKLKPVKLNKDGKENKHSKNNDYLNTQKSSSKNKNKSGLNELNGLSGSSSRSSSYSSIVSSNGETKVTKISKKSDNKHPGPIGQKPPGLSTSPWTAPESSLTNIGISSTDTLDNFILPPIQESNSSSRDTTIPPLNSFNFGSSDGNFTQLDNFHTFSPVPSNPWEGIRSKPMTMMQKLQAERRQRMELYRKQQAYRKNDMYFSLADWPGFEGHQLGDNLWDPNYSISQNELSNDSWPSASQAVSNNSFYINAHHDTQSSEELWNNMKYTSWNPVSNLWPSSNDPQTAQMMTETEQNQAGGEYDPFSNLMSIWDPNHHSQANGGPGPAENAWSNSFFTDNTHSDIE